MLQWDDSGTHPAYRGRAGAHALPGPREETWL
jgi:hypothetical protein